MPIEFKQSVTANAVGKVANMEEWNAITGIATGAIAFGVPVIAAGTKDTVSIVSAAAQNVLGISVMEQFLAHTGDAYAQYDLVTVLESGVIGAALSANVTKGAQARFDTVAGKWTGAAASATVLTIPGAQFDEAGSSGATGLVRYRRPVPSLSASS